MWSRWARVWGWNWLKWKIFDNITDITHVSDGLQLCEFEKQYHTVSVSISLPLSSAVDAPLISPYFPVFCSATLSFDVRFSMLTSGETWRLSCSDGKVTWRGWWMRLDVYGRKTTSTYWSRAAAALRFSAMFGELNRNWALLASSRYVEAIKNYIISKRRGSLKPTTAKITETTTWKQLLAYRKKQSIHKGVVPHVALCMAWVAWAWVARIAWMAWVACVAGWSGHIPRGHLHGVCGRLIAKLMWTIRAEETSTVFPGKKTTNQ